CNHAHHQRVLAPVDLEHDAITPSQGDSRCPRLAGARSRMSLDLRRRLLSTAVTAFCGLSILLALVPLGLIFFFVLSQGIPPLNLDFFTHIPLPGGEPACA